MDDNEREMNKTVSQLGLAVWALQHIAKKLMALEDFDDIAGAMSKAREVLEGPDKCMRFLHAEGFTGLAIKGGPNGIQEVIACTTDEILQSGDDVEKIICEPDGTPYACHNPDSGKAEKNTEEVREIVSKLSRLLYGGGEA